MCFAKTDDNEVHCKWSKPDVNCRTMLGLRCWPSATTTASSTYMAITGI
jgi:hypothetical protein